MIDKLNRVMLADSYKYTQPPQYPSNTVGMFGYAEARSNKVYDATVFVGLQYFLMKYFSAPIEAWEVHEAKNYAQYHGISFDYDGWMYIVEELDGKLPVEIKAVAEGSVIPTSNVLFTIESTDERVFWIVSWLETVLMNVWYSSNVATRSYYVRKMLEDYANKTQDNPNVAYQFHNFGARGSTCPEAAELGGIAHLMAGFMGSDNFSAMKAVERFYGCTKPTSSIEEYTENKKVFRSTTMHSINASEHSTTTSWGRQGEFEMVMNHLEINKGQPLIAAVADSYDYHTFVEKVTSGEFRFKIESPDYPIFVIRPDSGTPSVIINDTLDIMEKNHISYTTNIKGYKVFNKYRIIWGDGINMDNMELMLHILERRGYSSENIAFGSGGWLMQEHSRDTQSWAIKCSSIGIRKMDGIDYRDVFKDPKTASNKKSKRGRMTLYYNIKTGDFVTGAIDNPLLNDDDWFDVLRTVYKNGEMVNYTSLVEARERNSA